MSNEKNNKIYILLGCSAFVLLLFRHLYIFNPNLGWTELAPYKLIMEELISLLIGAMLCIGIIKSRRMSLKKSGYLFLLVLLGSAYIVFLMGSVLWDDLPDILPFINWKHLYMPVNYAQWIPCFTIVPVTMTYFFLEDDRKKRTWITLLVLAFCVITSSFFQKSLTGTYLLLLVCCIVFGVKEAKEEKFNWYMMGAIVLLTFIATVIAYVSSGCSTVEHFVIYQYEDYAAYIEGLWESIVVFDGTLADALSTTGLISGTRSSLQSLWTGTYDSPANVLLAYGWLAFIVHAIASIALIICSIALTRNINDKVIKNFGYLIIAKIIATTLFAYFMLPRTATPLGIRTAHFDFDLVWMIVLVTLSIKDSRIEKKIKEETADGKGAHDDSVDRSGTDYNAAEAEFVEITEEGER